MHTVKTITHILFPIFLGLIVGGAILDNTAAWVSGIVLLILDMIVGIGIQYLTEKYAAAKNRNNDYSAFIEQLKRNYSDDDATNLSIEDSDDMPHDNPDKTRGEVPYSNNFKMTDLIEKMPDIIYRLKIEGGARFFNTAFDDDEAAKFLLNVCMQTPNTPPLIYFSGLYQVSPYDLNGTPALMYFFRTHIGAYGMILRVILVRHSDYKIRFFTVETDYMPFLCEYKDGLHLNYGTTTLQDLSEKLTSILNKQ